MPKKLQKSGKTMGKLWDTCIKMLVSPGKMVGFTGKNAGFTKEHLFVFNGEFFCCRGLEMRVVGMGSLP